MKKIDRICPTCKKAFWGTNHIRKVYCSVACHKHRYKHDGVAEERFWAQVDKSGPCWIFTGAKLRDGYGHVVRLGKHMQAHRYSWMLLKGDPGNLDVLHHCDNPPCCNPDHLYLGTDQDNANDRVKRRRTLRGEKSPAAKLTEEQAREILSLKGRQRSQDLAQKYGVGSGAVTAIWRGAAWSHIQRSEA